MPKDNKYQIEFQPLGTRVSIQQGENLLDAARLAGIELTAACGGERSCGQCKLILQKGAVSDLTPDEHFLLDEDETKLNTRLACCTYPQTDLGVEIPRQSMTISPRLQVESNLSQIAVEPIVKAYDLSLQHPSLGNPDSDLTRILEAIEVKNIQAGLSVVQSLPEILRENNWQITAFIRDNKHNQPELVGLVPTGLQPLGYAVDIGTTKIAAYLVDLTSGDELAAQARANPQLSYGEDVVSRLTYARQNPGGGELLADKLQMAINELLGELLAKTNHIREQVVETCLVGNTAITHLLLNLPVSQLATAPYVPAVNQSLDIPASQIGLDIAPGAYVHIPPTIGGYVGADHVAMILATEMLDSEKTALGIDIGTNTEISIRKAALPQLMSVSCASGPAFEGAHIGAGMRASSGAIEKLKITEGKIEVKTIDNQPAIGLCGSGIIDTIAELHRTGLINFRGRLQSDNHLINAIEDPLSITLVSKSESGTEQPIKITQNDITEIQMAKGAIQAGLVTLLDKTDTSLEEVEEVIIAGAFGSFIDVENAISIGLLPNLPKATYRQVGNAAALGAKWMLLSLSARERARRIKEQTRYFELSTHPRFKRNFAKGMMLG